MVFSIALRQGGRTRATIESLLTPGGFPSGVETLRSGQRRPAGGRSNSSLRGLVPTFEYWFPRVRTWTKS